MQLSFPTNISACSALRWISLISPSSSTMVVRKSRESAVLSSSIDISFFASSHRCPKRWHLIARAQSAVHVHRALSNMLEYAPVKYSAFWTALARSSLPVTRVTRTGESVSIGARLGAAVLQPLLIISQRTTSLPRAVFPHGIFEPINGGPQSLYQYE